MRSEGSSRLRRISRRKLVFGRLVEVLTMMQSCTSAKLRGGGANLPVGIGASSNHGFPPPRIVNSECAEKSARAPNSSSGNARSGNPF